MAAKSPMDSQSSSMAPARVSYDIDSAAQRIFDTELDTNSGNRLFLGIQVRHP